MSLTGLNQKGASLAGSKLQNMSDLIIKWSKEGKIRHQNSLFPSVMLFKIEFKTNFNILVDHLWLTQANCRASKFAST